MKKLLIATAALSLMTTGASFAQTSGMTPGGGAAASTTDPGAAPTPSPAGATISSDTANGAQNQGARVGGTGSMEPGANPGGAPAPTGRDTMSSGSMGSTPPMSSGSMSTGSMPMGSTAMTGNTPSGDAPSTYPVCTSKGQDRCQQRGHMAKHHKM